MGRIRVHEWMNLLNCEDDLAAQHMMRQEGRETGDRIRFAGGKNWWGSMGRRQGFRGFESAKVIGVESGRCGRIFWEKPPACRISYLKKKTTKKGCATAKLLRKGREGYRRTEEGKERS